MVGGAAGAVARSATAGAVETAPDSKTAPKLAKLSFELKWERDYHQNTQSMKLSSVIQQQTSLFFRFSSIITQVSAIVKSYVFLIHLNTIVGSC